MPAALNPKPYFDVEKFNHLAMCLSWTLNINEIMPAALNPKPYFDVEKFDHLAMCLSCQGPLTCNQALTVFQEFCIFQNTGAGRRPVNLITIH